MMIINYPGLTERDGSPDINFGVAETTATRTYTGTFEDCLAGAPKPGAAYQDLPVEDLRVVRARVANQRGGLALLTVELSDSIGGGGGGGADPATLEVDWTLIERPIETAPPFRNLDPQVLAQIRAWEDLPFRAVARKLAFHFPATAEPDPKNNAHWIAFTGAALLLAHKKAAGVESWQVPAPIVRRTRRSWDRPTVSRCGRRENPPIAVPGYEFIKTADRAIREGRGGPWKRSEEWTGAERWDPDLYPASGAERWYPDLYPAS